MDVADRDHPKLVSDLLTDEARGLCVQWPRVLVADGPGGLAVADISVPANPRLAGRMLLTPPSETGQSDARAVAAIFQYGRPQGTGPRTPARMLAAIADGRFGLAVADVTEPEAPRLLTRPGGKFPKDFEAIDVAVCSRFDLGDTAGAKPTVEHDVAYLLASDGKAGVSMLFDLSDPEHPAQLSRAAIGPGSNVPPVAGLTLVRSFNPPELVSRLLVAGDGGLLFQDVTRSGDAKNGSRLPGVPGARSVAAEAFAFDRTIDETGRQLKDHSHAGVRWFTPAEVHNVLTVPGEALGTLQDAAALRAETGGSKAVAGGDVGAGLDVQRRDPAADAQLLQRLANGFRIAEAEDLARLVRHAWPPDFDHNHDQALSRGELEDLVWWVLDANGDGHLDRLEWPRHPGQDPGALDKNHDGQISRAEMDLGPEVFRFFDPDGDGLAEFREWPFHRRQPAAADALLRHARLGGEAARTAGASSRRGRSSITRWSDSRTSTATTRSSPSTCRK